MSRECAHCGIDMTRWRRTFATEVGWMPQEARYCTERCADLALGESLREEQRQRRNAGHQPRNEDLRESILGCCAFSSSFCMDNAEEREALTDAIATEIEGRFRLVLR